MKKQDFTLENLVIEVDETEFILTRNELLEIHYMEDITKSNIVVALTITDTQSSIVSKLFGMEPILVSWTCNETTVTLPLIIYDIKDRVLFKGKRRATIYCCSRDAINNASAKLSIRFGSGGGESISDIVRRLLETTLGSTKTINTDDTETKISFISPYWDPFTIISWMSWRAIPVVEEAEFKPSAGYLFWETPMQYNFRSMDLLCRDEVKKTILVGHEDKPEDYDENVVHVDSFTISGSSDVFRGLNLGSYNSTMMTIDLKDFSYKEIPFNVNKYYDSMVKMNKDSVLPKYYEDVFGDGSQQIQPTRIMSRVIDTAMYTEGKYTQDLTRQLSQSMIRNQFFFNQAGTFEYYGDQDLMCGDIVDITTLKGKNKDIDTVQSGRYIVGKIYRQFTADSEQMVTRVTVYRDSMGTETMEEV